METGLLVYVGCGLSRLENFDHFNLLYPALLLSLSSTFIKPCEPVLIFLFSAQDKKTELGSSGEWRTFLRLLLFSSLLHPVVCSFR